MIFSDQQKHQCCSILIKGAFLWLVTEFGRILFNLARDIESKLINTQQECPPEAQITFTCTFSKIEFSIVWRKHSKLSQFFD